MLGPLLAAALVLLASYLYRLVWHKRFKQYASIPQLPPSLVLGHLKTFDDFIKRGKADRHPDMIFSEMHDTIGRPPLMFVDLRPVNRPMVLVTSHEIAEQISRASKLFPTSVPKASLNYLVHLIGPTSIIAAHGDTWKALRKRFNPGFAPQHLMTLLPAILSKTSGFVGHLDALARSGNDFAVAPLIINLTFDIIGAVVMDVDLQAQRKDNQGELIQLFGNLLKQYSDDKADLPWWLQPRVILERHRLGTRIDVILRAIVRRKYADYLEQKHGGHGASPPTLSSRSILYLSFQDITAPLTNDLVNETADQLKTFLLAGHDTTSVTLAWVFYELSRTPRALRAVRAELDTILGDDADPDAIRAQLLQPHGPDLIYRMSYISAVIKETMRLHPPAATARTSPFGSNLTVHTPDGVEHNLDGTIIYSCNTIIHRDAAVYGASVDEFRPERWLGGGASQIPASSWRPFERGPRNCIGQEFATIEARVIIAAVARRYDFTKVGLGEMEMDKDNRPILDETSDQFKVKSLLYTTRQVTVKPADSMRMKVKMAAA
ncbi:cytochrome P450 52A11 [Bombardia bombarda]|uniref:Cytochrome P450 52A11 n=1 Tax=Bombardia bombarda TaxID=252184 RepID=A0AA39XB90_9PEZI|nr:cytochrome P450 52A11 [Bombardia bombarda]